MMNKKDIKDINDDSTDSNRGAFELKYAQKVTFHEPFHLEQGGILPDPTLVYETYGTLNEARDNAVLICHALTGDSHVARHNAEDHEGWWEILVGPGKSVDTNRYFVICPNILGGCRGSSGPGSVNPKTGNPYGSDFPTVTMGDNVNIQKMLVEHLGITQLLAVIGGSLGGMMGMIWGARYPNMLRGAAILASGYRLTSQALAFDIVGRNAITSDPDFAGGQYYGKCGPRVGLAIARMLGHITYLSRESMMRKFDEDRNQPKPLDSNFELQFSVGSYLAYQGDRFNDRFDANSYITLTMASDLFDLGGNSEDIARALSPSKCKWLFISYSSDWLFPPFQSEMIVSALVAQKKPVTYCQVQSDCGHDAFLLPNQLSTYGGLVEKFLRNLHHKISSDEISDVSVKTCTEAVTRNVYGTGAVEESSSEKKDYQAFYNPLVKPRIDYDYILELVPVHASVLDLGCGNGDLLHALRQRSEKARLMGIELNERAIQKCVALGFDVIQRDLNDGLNDFHDRQFEYVVLSQTLQTIMDVEGVLEEMLRVGRRGIVTFPNAAYLPWRKQLFHDGRMPSIGCAPGVSWYNTQNVRFFTISDFHAFCEDKGYSITHQIALNTEKHCRVEENPNDNATLAILEVSR